MASVAATTCETAAKSDDRQAFETQGVEQPNAVPLQSRTEQVLEVLELSRFCLELQQPLELLPEQPLDEGLSTDGDSLLQGSASWGLRNSRKPEQGGEIRHTGKPEQRVEIRMIRHTGPERYDKEECMPMWWKDMKETVARNKRPEEATSAGSSYQLDDASSETRAPSLVSPHGLTSDTLTTCRGTRSRVSRHVLTPTSDTLTSHAGTRDTRTSHAPRAPSSGAPASGRPSSHVRRLTTGNPAGAQVRAVLALVQEEHAVWDLDPDRRTMPYPPKLLLRARRGRP